MCLNLHKHVFVRTVLLLFLTAGLSHARAQSPVHIDQLGEKIKQSLKNGNTDVLEELNKLLADSHKIGYKPGIAQYHGLKGLYCQDINNYSAAQNHLHRSLRLYEELNLWDKTAGASNNIGNLFYKTKHYKQAFGYYKKALFYHKKSGDKRKYASTCNNIGASYHNEGDDTTALFFYNLGFASVDSLADPINYANLLLNKGGAYAELGLSDSAEYYYRKALPSFERVGNPEGLAKIYYNLGYHYEMEGLPERALPYYQRSLAIAQKAGRNGDMASPIEGLLLVHNQLGNTDSVDYYYIELATLNEVLFQERNDKNIQEAVAKYNLEKERRKNEHDIASEQLKSSNMLLGLVFTVLVSILFALGFWIFQQRKRQKIHKQLQQQEREINRLVRTQEVLAFQSQLEGEAQERKRIAQELHDRVGGLLATLNLHFEAFTEKHGQMPEGPQLQELVKTSIREVRTISHNLQGIGQGTDLRLALEQLEKGINSTGKLQFQLFYEVPDGRLSNLLVNELYKIVQELVTNTLKHANAAVITLQISLLENDLQLIYEDNGTGFDPETIKRGMGLGNIFQRAEHLDGTCTIDSRIGKGSTIILQIPLKS